MGLLKIILQLPSRFSSFSSSCINSWYRPGVHRLSVRSKTCAQIEARNKLRRFSMNTSPHRIDMEFAAGIRSLGCNVISWRKTPSGGNRDWDFSNLFRLLFILIHNSYSIPEVIGINGEDLIRIFSSAHRSPFETRECGDNWMKFFLPQPVGFNRFHTHDLRASNYLTGERD